MERVIRYQFTPALGIAEFFFCARMPAHHLAVGFYRAGIDADHAYAVLVTVGAQRA